jgi:hypothetical protein
VVVLGNHHASGGLVGELGIELEAEGLEEGHRLVEVLDGQVDKKFSWHGWCLQYSPAFEGPACVIVTYSARGRILDDG